MRALLDSDRLVHREVFARIFMEVLNVLCLLDMSLSPKVVWTLAPTIKCSFQRTRFAFGAVERVKSANSFSQIIALSTRL